MKINLFIITVIFFLCHAPMQAQVAQSISQKVRIQRQNETQDGIAQDKYLQQSTSPMSYESTASTFKLIRQNPHSKMKTDAVSVADILTPNANNLTKQPLHPTNTAISPLPQPTAKQQQPNSSQPIKPQPSQEQAPSQQAMVQASVNKNDGFKIKANQSDIKWRSASSGNFNMRMAPHKSGIATPNLSMKFETVHQVLRKNISWMMGGKTNIMVYADKRSFLKHEGMDTDWAGAFFSPSDNRIVMYDEPSNINRMVELFSHELTHLFVEGYFNPPARIFKVEPPIWLNEGLAVNMEDISSGKGGIWGRDLAFMTILSNGDKKVLIDSANTNQRLGARKRKVKLPKHTVFFKNFTDFIRDDSYDKAVADNDAENWYLQAYAMVRFLFRPYNATYPEKRIQFEQFTKILSDYKPKLGANGKAIKTDQGQVLIIRPSVEEALRRAYGFKNIKDFEAKFWAWMRDMQKRAREADQK